MPKLGFKLFFIGFNKCGTRSLHRYLTGCGINAYHGGAHADMHQAILINVVRGMPALSGVDDYDAYLDVRAIQSQFRHLDRDYPGSKFVFNVRDTNRWILSRLNHINGRYVDLMNLYYGLELSWTEWADRWRHEFAAHERAVTAHFRDRPSDFLRFDVERDSPDALVAFIGVPPPETRDELPRLGVTAKKHFAFDGDRIVKLSP
jgi:Sulfotransferase domain